MNESREEQKIVMVAKACEHAFKRRTTLRTSAVSVPR